MADNIDTNTQDNPSNGRIKERNHTLDWEGIDSERLRALKQSRSATKGLVTKAQNDVRNLMRDSTNVELVKTKLEDLNLIVEDFNNAHHAYHQNLSDEHAIKESNEYFEAVNQSMADLVNEVARWIEPSINLPAETLTSATVEPPELKPEDSVSNVGSRASTKLSRRSGSVTSRASRASSISAAKTKAAAKRAVLEAEAANLERIQAIQREELSLQMKRKQVELQTEIAKAQAEEHVYAEAEAGASQVGSYAALSQLAKSKASPIIRSSESTQVRANCHNTDNLPENVPAEPSASNPEANSFLPKIRAYDDRKAIKSPYSPKVKEETNKSELDDPVLVASLAQSLLEAQHQQNCRMQELIQRQQESTLALTLPQPEVPTFSGNPIEYWTFIRAFENLIESKTSSQSTRLYYLVQYTTGEVRELVKSCLAMKEEVGYREARDLLKKRYGQSYRIATAYVDKLAKGPAIKAEDGDALRRFSTLLTSCKNTLKEIGYLNKVENPDTLKAIVSRLPYGLRQKWRDVADNVTENQGREVTIEDLSDFVTAKARAATHAIFGDISSHSLPSAGSVKAKQKPVARNASSFTTQTGSKQASGDDTRRQQYQDRRKCPLCGSTHWLSQCSDFKRKTLNERLAFVRSKGLCDNCLVPGHRPSSCSRPRFCRVTGCNGNHSSFLHPRSVEQPPNLSSENRTSTEVTPRTQDGDREAVNSYIKGRNETPNKGERDLVAVTGLAVVPVKVKAPGQDVAVETYAFLDSGSNSSFCSEDLAHQLGLSGQQTTLALTTMEKENSRAESHILRLEVLDLEEENLVELPMVFTRPKLPVSTDNAANQEDIDRWPHLAGIKVPRIDAGVGLLIGSDAPEVLEPKEIRPSRNGGPYATRTVFGWVVNGPLRRSQSYAVRTANFIKADVELGEQFRNYCNMEFSDSVYGGKSSMSQEDKRALDIMNETAKLENGHYEIALPWKINPPCLDNNKIVAQHRLSLLKKRLLKDQDLFTKYKSCIDDLLQKGYAKKAPESNIPGKTWYLPHHAVFHPAKPGKVRVVFDCSAKYRGSSLNDLRLQGPDFTNSLVGVLTRFRQETVALMSDVEAMFHQVRVKPDDCSALRFLWWPNGNLSSEPEEFMMTVHLFGGVSSPSCANFALRKTADDNKANFDPQIVRTVDRNFYVDDCLKSVKSEHDAIYLVKNLTELLKKGGFRLTKWLSNSRGVVESIPESERATSVKNLDFGHAPIERALGVQWCVSSDTFGFSIIVKDRPATRRGILSVVSSVYDPLGFVSPFILSAKILLQDLCRKKLNWDDKIPDEDLQRWKSWLETLPKLEQFSVDRCFKPPDFGEVISSQLHYFSDASEVAYGAVAYLRLVNASGVVYCSFVIGKSRLSPLKPVTIPRLELSAAVLSTRLDRMILEEIEVAVDESVYWTDSTCVLRYIENEERRFQTFVANRVAAIREQSLPSQWRYVETKLNPADDASRGMTVEAITESNRWIRGPDFLWQNEENWPKRPPVMDQDTEDHCAPEVKKATFVSLSHPAIVEIDKLFDRFSSWFQLNKFVAWMLRYKSHLRHAVAKRKRGEALQFNSERKVNPLDVKEMEHSEKAIIKAVQGRSFHDELLSLTSSRREVKKSSSITKLDPILVDGVIRVGGRLHNSPIKQEAKHPVILPKDHHISGLIIRQYHLISGHSGVEHTLSLIRLRYWITQARVSIRRILNSCFDCSRRQASAGQQKMASLPEDRVNPSNPPFSYVGVDCFGPLEVRRGRSMVKRYGVLFTCLSIRAIHIEIAHSLDTDSFINAFRRFIARRGQPSLMRSDNGGNFVKGDKELREAIDEWNHGKIHDFLLAKDIKWIFNPPAGSHHGGVWERCIRTTRKVMKALLKEQPLDDEGLLTLMAEVEAIINGRPITKVSDDPRDPEALTPNHLLLLRSGPTLPPGLFVKGDNYSRRRWRHVQYLADVFWRRWLREYLPALQERQKWSRVSRNFAVGDVVLLVDENLPRSSWPLGRILEVFPNQKDGLVRSVRVKTRTSVLVRPIDKIVLLEAAGT